jgi:hypothetical protein
VRALSGVVIVLLVWAAFATPARADDFERFQQAYGAYTAQQYTEAIAQLTALVAANEASTDARPLVLESLKYLAASHLFLGHGADAERTFERLLSLEPDYVLDPLAFPEEVQLVYARVKTRMDAERHSEAELARSQRESCSAAAP